MTYVKKRKALVTGATGQDGAYLIELLLDKGYLVTGTYRRNSQQSFKRLEMLGVRDHKSLKLVELDLTDLGCIIRLVDDVKPDEIYNLAAQSFVGVSFSQPRTTADITAIGALNILEAVKLTGGHAKFYQASTSEMFGKVQETPQTERTPFYPRSPYGVAKLYAHWITVNYRESYNLFATSGILFNHESPLRGEEFVTRKITSTLAGIKYGKSDCLELGNINAVRDWGFAKEYVDGMWRMMQHSKPDTFVLATNKTVSVREFLIHAMNVCDLDCEFEGDGINEMARNKRDGKIVFRVNPEFYRPAEVDFLMGSYDKAKKDLEWEPQTTVWELCELMMNHDLKTVV